MLKPRILVVGSINMDITVRLDKVPNEGETLLGKSLTMFPGGKGANQAVQISRLGALTSFIGCVGNDKNGETLTKVLEDNNIDISHISRTNEASTGTAIILLENYKNRIIVVQGANMEIKEKNISWLRNEITSFDCIVLQLEIPLNINMMVAKIAFENNIKVILNPAPYYPLPNEFYKYLDYIIPNEHELLQLLRIEKEIDFNNNKELADLCRKLLNHGVKNVIVTLGSKGSLLVNNSEVIHAPSQLVEAVDTTAAGDSYVGALAYALASDLDINEAMKFATKVAAITVTKEGAIPSLPTYEEVERY